MFETKRFLLGGWRRLKRKWRSANFPTGLFAQRRRKVIVAGQQTQRHPARVGQVRIDGLSLASRL